MNAIAGFILSTCAEVGAYRANSFAFTDDHLLTKPKKNNLTDGVLSALHSNFAAVACAAFGIVGASSFCFSSSTMRVLLILYLSATEIAVSGPFKEIRKVIDSLFRAKSIAALGSGEVEMFFF